MKAKFTSFLKQCSEFIDFLDVINPGHKTPTCYGGMIMDTVNICDLCWFNKMPIGQWLGKKNRWGDQTRILGRRNTETQSRARQRGNKMRIPH